MMFAVATGAILIVMAMMLVRAFIGPTFTDRILAVFSQDDLSFSISHCCMHLLTSSAHSQS